jgi:hypothetical protein
MLLLVVRSSFGFLSVLASGAALYAVAVYTSGAADASELRGLTSIPTGFWSAFWFLGSVAALGLGGYLLV